MIESRRMRCARHVTRIGRREEERIWVIVGKARGKETTRKTKPEVSGYIKMDLEEVGWGDVDWIGLPQDRYKWRVLLNSVMNLRVP
jgi:hypothetical protein